MASSVVWPINTIWTEKSTNFLDLDDVAYEKGIEFQSRIVSNQVNGYMRQATQNMQHIQTSIAHYHPKKTYFKGHCVSMKLYITKTDDNAYQGWGNSLMFFECINDNNGAGITAVPPMNGLTMADANGVLTWTKPPTATVNPNWAVIGALGKSDEAGESKDNPQQTTAMDDWYVFNNVQGTFNLNLDAPDVLTHDNFIINLTGTTTFGTISGTQRQRSGLIIVNGVKDYLDEFFTNAYYSFFTTGGRPKNSDDGNVIVYPYYAVSKTRTGLAQDMFIFTTI